MKRRTEGETKAYVEGYNACYDQFCKYLQCRKSVAEAVSKMAILVTAVNAVAEKEGDAE